MSADTITIGDARKAGYCVKGIREWHDNNGRDFKDFVKNGMSIETALAINDAMLNHVIALKRGESNG